MSYFRFLALAVALSAALVAGSADRATGAAAVASRLGAITHQGTADSAARGVVRVQKTPGGARQNARPGNRRARQNNRPARARTQKVTRPGNRRAARQNNRRSRQVVRQGNRKSRRNVRPDKPKLRRDVRPGKRRARKHSDRKHANRKHANRKHANRKHQKHRRHRKVRIYGGFYPYYSYGGYPDSNAYYTPRRYGAADGTCEYWNEECIAAWGYLNADYYGCMRYHHCQDYAE